MTERLSVHKIDDAKERRSRDQHDLITRLDELAVRLGHQLSPSRDRRGRLPSMLSAVRSARAAPIRSAYNGYGDPIDVSRAGRIARAFQPP